MGVYDKTQRPVYVCLYPYILEIGVARPRKMQPHQQNKHLDIHKLGWKDFGGNQLLITNSQRINIIDLNKIHLVMILNI